MHARHANGGFLATEEQRTPYDDEASHSALDVRNLWRETVSL